MQEPNAFILPKESAARLRRYFESLPAWPGRDFIDMLDGLPAIVVSTGEPETASRGDPDATG